MSHPALNSADEMEYSKLYVSCRVWNCQLLPGNNMFFPHGSNGMTRTIWSISVWRELSRGADCDLETVSLTTILSPSKPGGLGGSFRRRETRRSHFCCAKILMRFSNRRRGDSMRFRLSRQWHWKWRVISTSTAPHFSMIL